MRRLFSLLVVSMTTIVAFAQGTVSGTVIEQDTEEAVIQATAAVMKGQKIVANAVTNTNGAFSIRVPSDGTYDLRITYVGFKTYSKKIKIEGKNVPLGTIKLEADAIMLNGATVTGHAAKVILKADTFVYNANAFRTPEGSVVEELVRRELPVAGDDEGALLGVLPDIESPRRG